MSVMKVIEISSASTKSFEDAVHRGLNRTGETVRNMCSAQIDKQFVTIENEQIREFHVDMKVKFEVKE